MSRADRFVGVRVHAERDPDQHPLDTGGRGEARLVPRVEHDRRADLRRLPQERLVLVVAVDDEVAAREAGGTRERQLAGGGDVRADARLVQQPEHGDVGERLRPEEDPPVADGRAERMRPLAQRLLAEDDERRPVRSASSAAATPPSVSPPSSRAADCGKSASTRRSCLLEWDSCSSFSRSPGSETRRRRAGLPLASRPRGFFVPGRYSRRWKSETERYDPTAVEAKWQAGLGRRGRVHGPEPRPGRGDRQVDLRARDASVPLRRAAHGPRSQLHARRRPHARPAPAAAARCCARWVTTRSACPPRTRRSRKAATRARSRTQHRGDPPRRCGAWAGRSTGRARSRPPSPSTTAGRSGCSCASSSAASPTASEAPVKWCPKDQTVLANEQVIDGRCERCGTEVEARNLDAVVLQDHRLRRPAARRDGAARVLARARADDAAELDRPLGGRARHVPRSPGAARSCPSSRRGPTRSSAPPSSCWRRSIR